MTGSNRMAESGTRVSDRAGVVAEAEKLLALPGRRFIAVCGAPGSGKSTFAQRICADIEAQSPGAAAVLQMDGFHYDNAVLEARGRLPWKGAPDTFDVGGLRSAIRRLSDPSEGAVAVPVFDRELEISRGAARIISPDVRLVIVEGNYLLLRREPWSALAQLFDLTVYLRVSAQELRRRLTQRWEDCGLPPETVTFKIEENDYPNGLTVIEESRPADLTVEN